MTIEINSKWAHHTGGMARVLSVTERHVVLEDVRGGGAPYVVSQRRFFDNYTIEGDESPAVQIHPSRRFLIWVGSIRTMTWASSPDRADAYLDLAADILTWRAKDGIPIDQTDLRRVDW